MAEPIYHVHTVACGYDERSDWVIQTYLIAEAENKYLLDRIILPEPDSAAQKYRYWSLSRSWLTAALGGHCLTNG